MIYPSFTLYHFPGACSQVTRCALEMAGVPYDLKIVNIMKGEQTTADYRALSPMGKVPHAVVGGVNLSENPAILTYLADAYPEAGIFPAINSPMDRAQVASALAFFSATVQPQVRGMFNPKRMTTGETDGVRDMAMQLGKQSFDYADFRIAENGWWMGVPSILDIYLNWAFDIAGKAGYEGEGHSHLLGLTDRIGRAIPAFATVMKSELDLYQHLMTPQA